MSTETAHTTVATPPLPDAITEPGPAIRRTAARLRHLLPWAVIAALTAIAVTAAGLSISGRYLTSVPGTDTSVTVVDPGPAVGSQEFLNRLAQSGYIPKQAVDTYQLQVERAVSSGLIPAQSLPAATDGTTYHERLRDAVRSGSVPQESLDGYATTVERLANSGLIPRAAAE